MPVSRKKSSKFCRVRVIPWMYILLSQKEENKPWRVLQLSSIIFTAGESNTLNQILQTIYSFSSSQSIFFLATAHLRCCLEFFGQYFQRKMTLQYSWKGIWWCLIQMLLAQVTSWPQKTRTLWLWFSVSISLKMFSINGKPLGRKVMNKF